jgi:hypothetical protein
VTCIGAKPPLNLDAWLSAVNACATAAGGPEWASTALLGLQAVVLLLAVALLLGALVVRR